MNENAKAILAAFIACVIWGIAFPVTKIALGSVAPFALAFARAFFASILFLGILIAAKKLGELIKFFRENIIFVFLLGFTGTAIVLFFENAGMTYSSSALASVLANVSPVFVLILAFFFLKEKMSFGKVSGIFVGFIGLIFVIFLDNWNFSINSDFIGSALFLGSSLSWAVYSIINKKLAKNYSPLVLTSAAYFSGALMLFIPWILFEGAAFAPDFSSWIMVLYLVFLGSPAFFLWNYAISKMDVSRVSYFIYLIPVIGVFVGVVFLNEIFTLFDAIGTLLIIFGLYLAEKK